MVESTKQAIENHKRIKKEGAVVKSSGDGQQTLLEHKFVIQIQNIKTFLFFNNTCAASAYPLILAITFSPSLSAFSPLTRTNAAAPSLYRNRIPKRLSEHRKAKLANRMLSIIKS